MNLFRYRIYMSVIVSILLLVTTLNCQARAVVTNTTTLYPARVNTDKGEFYGYIDEQGKWKIDPVYQIAYPFENGVAGV